MKILLVEDESHKRAEITQCVNDVFDFEPSQVDSVNNAVLSIKDHNFDLIILDMALPTFGESSSDNRKGHDQAQGGIEVLRALKMFKKSVKVIIITQYPDFFYRWKKN